MAMAPTKPTTPAKPTTRTPKFTPLRSHDRQGAPLRDAITGEALQRGTRRLAVSDERLENARYVRQDGDPAETTPHPLRLHTPMVEEGGLGGHCFARQFAVYLARVKPLGVALAELERRYWWASAYGRRRVEARFMRRFGLEMGGVRYRVAISLASGYRSYEQLMAETRHSASWLADQQILAEKYAKELPGSVRVVRPIVQPGQRREVAE